MKRYIVILAGIALVITGCATSKDLRTVSHSLGTKISAVEHDLSSMKKEVAHLQETSNQIETRSKSLSKNQADAGADVITLRDEVRNLRGELETIRNALSVLESSIKGEEAAGIRGKLDDLSFRIQYVENFIGIGKKSEQEKEPAKAAEGRKDASGIDKEKAYADAYDSFKAGNYAEAREKFRTFIKTFPDTEYSDNAQFWIGECFYVDKEYEKAILEYESVIKKYPKGNKVPNAILKQALAFVKLGDNESAKLLFQRVIREYPNTSPARIARKRLSES
ncbi:MAG: tol-pal system protein YbgF [Deltaproteobacteria bacterium]|nr:tol-pal system protein YbgF [Deltaproteobacteria bacterium]MBN2686647.1 tol-pal system protein YbgF [Deltaproteobacteria bacterium]